MFMRLFQVKVNPIQIEQFKNFYEDTVFPAFNEIPGCIFAGLVKGSSDNNEYISITFWETEQKADDFENSEVYKNLINEEKIFFSESEEWKVQLSDKMELEYSPVAEEPVVKKYSVELQKDEDKLRIQSPQMFLRIVSLIIQDDKLEEFKDIYLNKVIPALKLTEGCRYVFLTESVNNKNEFISVTFWDNKHYAEEYEQSGKFTELTDKVKHTFSQFYLWKMALEDEFSAKIKTTDDLKVGSYNIVAGKSFL